MVDSVRRLRMSACPERRHLQKGELMRYGTSISHTCVVVAVWCLGAVTPGCAESPDAEPPADPDGASTTATAALSPTDAFGDTFIANEFRPGVQAFTSVSSCEDGDSVVLWSDGPRAGLFTRRFSAAGIAAPRSERVVDLGSTPTPGIGCFAVARGAPDGSGFGIYVSVFDRSGTLVVPEFRVNDNTAGDQVGPRVAINASGEFVVVWQEGTPNIISAKLFRANGVAVAPAQTVFTTTATAVDPHVALNNWGEFVVAWDLFLGSANYDIYFRRFSF